jgi:two-component system cell cycle sensor histidine kinase/response regulator CckA
MELSGFARNIVETIREPLIVLDSNLRVIFANLNFYKTFEVKPDKTLGKFIFDLGNRQWNIPKLRKLLEEIISKNTKFENYEVEHKFPGIGNKIMLLNARRIYHEDADSEMILLAIEDMTDRIEMGRELKESEELFRRLFETSKDGLLLIEKNEKKIVKVNPAILELLKFSRKDLVGYKLSEVGIFKDRELLETAYQNVNNYGFVFFENIQVESKEGERILTELYLIDRAKLIQCNIRDITERKKLEEDMLKSQKLESIGLLAGGIAHDFNNLLTAILGNINLAKMSINMESGAYRYLEAANKASDRAGQLTQQLLTFSQGGTAKKKPESIAKIIKESDILALSGSGIKTEFDIPENLWPVEVDESQINQMFFNIITNAKQASPEGGTIKIKAENTILEKNKISLKSGNYVKISIEDNGVGISKDNISKIFDPYFTTKQKGKGIGLAVAYSIAKKHNGYITVVSTLGVGTTFILYFPASDDKIIIKKKEKKKSLKGKGRLLIMDDEEMVRDVLGKLLKKLGYEVGYAADGAEAIKMYITAKQSEQPFAAVIMDLTIPGGMGGKIAIRKLKEIDPKVKAIVASGYSNDPIMANFNAYGFEAAISKPYTIMEIGKILREVLVKKNNS